MISRLARRFSFKVTPHEKVRLYSGPSPFEVFTKLSNQLGTFNFGHGSPDSHPPEFMKEALVQAMNDKTNQHQYTRPMGHPGLSEEIARQYSPSFGRTIDPVNEVCNGVGATGIISNTLYSFIQPGDEMVCFEPSFLGYAPLFHIVGAKVTIA
jgi:aspartate/methionine/tyrosine aminotransferase